MPYNVINISDEEFANLSVAQKKLLRAAQQEKDELIYKADLEVKTAEDKIVAAGMKNSTLLGDKIEAIGKRTEYCCGIIADNLLFAMSIAGGGSWGNSGEDYGVEYLVDYSLSYSERYVIVRDYYLQFTDVEERMRRYAADEVAKKYLGTYYGTLFNILGTYEK